MNATATKELLSVSEATRILSSQNFVLAEHQPYISGERFLMAKNKLVLGAIHTPSNTNVVIKISNVPAGQKEIRDEKNIREVLHSLAFANRVIAFPKEIFFSDSDTHTIFATEFIEQEKVFVVHTLEEQFFMALRAFEAQEAFHATTFEHVNAVKGVFEVFDEKKYIEILHTFVDTLEHEWGNREETRTLARAEKFFKEHYRIIERYGRFLTHTDFVPHNFRIQNNEVYMLDCSAVHFGNKYEGWARFLNYMYIHNPELERLLTEYLRTNRGEKECLCLRLMRAYKVGHLLAYYARSLKDTEGNLRALTEIRIKFWGRILSSILEDIPPKEEIITTYRTERNKLRSPEEKERQKDFAVS